MQRDRRVRLLAAVWVWGLGLAGCGADAAEMAGTDADAHGGDVSMEAGVGDADRDAEEAPYVYFALTSTTVSPEALAGSMPGPDIDAIELIQAGQAYWSSRIVAFEAGPQTGGLNDFDDPEAVVGEIDAIPVNGGTCSLDPDPPRFWSMGGIGGYVVVEFGRPFGPDDLVSVWEVNDIICDNDEAIDADFVEGWVAPAGVDTPPGMAGWVGVFDVQESPLPTFDVGWER